MLRMSTGRLSDTNKVELTYLLHAGACTVWGGLARAADVARPLDGGSAHRMYVTAGASAVAACSCHVCSALRRLGAHVEGMACGVQSAGVAAVHSDAARSPTHGCASPQILVVACSDVGFKASNNKHTHGCTMPLLHLARVVASA